MNYRPILVGLLCTTLGFALGVSFAANETTTEGGEPIPPRFQQIAVGLQHNPELLASPLDELEGLAEKKEWEDLTPAQVSSFRKVFLPEGEAPSDRDAINEYVHNLILALEAPVNDDLTAEARARKVRIMNYLLIRAYQQNDGYRDRMSRALESASAYQDAQYTADSAAGIQEVMQQEPYKTWLYALDTTDLNPPLFPQAD